MKACVFSYEELAEIRPLYPQHPEFWSRIPDNLPLRERLEELGIRILESGLKTGLIAEVGPANQWWRYVQISMPSNFGTNKSALPKSTSRCHACFVVTISSNQSSRAAALLREKRRPAGRNNTLDLFNQPEEISEGASDVLATGLLEDVQGIIGFHNMPQLKAGQLALNAGAMMAG